MTIEYSFWVFSGASWVAVIVLGIAWSRSQTELARVRSDRDFLETSRDDYRALLSTAYRALDRAKEKPGLPLKEPPKGPRTSVWEHLEEDP